VKFKRIIGLTLALTAASLAQDVISAHSGLIHYTEGDVNVDGKAVARKAAEFPTMKEGQELRTDRGRVEVLLTPGVFLRVAENSGVRMVKNQLMDTKLELLQGSALLEVGELDKTQALTMAVGNSNIEFAKKGLFRLDAEPARIRAYDGSALVIGENERLTLKEGHEATLGSTLVSSKFNKDDDDAFYRWASRRSSYIAAANVASARTVHDNGGMSFASSSWMYNPYLGMFTYLPYSGMYMSPFGYRYYSPLTVSQYYYRPPMVYSGGRSGFSGPPAASTAYLGATGQRSAMMGSHGSIGSYGGRGGMSGGGVSSGAVSQGSVSSGGGGHMSSGGASRGGGGGGLGHR